MSTNLESEEAFNRGLERCDSWFLNVHFQQLGYVMDGS